MSLSPAGCGTGGGSLVVVFVCAGCGAALSAPVGRAALPDHAHQKWGNGVLMPVLMDPGTYAVDPGAVVLAPGDVRGTVLVPERCAGHCCGLDGSAGPNLACAGCGRMVGSRIDDCSLWQSVRLEADAVRSTGSDPVPEGWEEALAGARWVEPPGGPWPDRPLELWNRAAAFEGVWEAAAGAALARLVAVSAGARVVWEGRLSGVFSGAWEALFPGGGPRLRVAAAGPGVGEPDADVLVVPVHPGSGAVWEPGGSVPVVPLAGGAWAHLVLPGGPGPAVVSGGVPGEVLRGEVSVEVLPWRRFRPDRGVFLEVLARVPQVREPGVRAVYERVRGTWDSW